VSVYDGVEGISKRKFVWW